MYTTQTKDQSIVIGHSALSVVVVSWKELGQLMSDPFSHFSPMGVMLELDIVVEVDLLVGHLLYDVILIEVRLLLLTLFFLLRLFVFFHMTADYYLWGFVLFRKHLLILLFGLCSVVENDNVALDCRLVFKLSVVGRFLFGVVVLL